MTLTLTVKTITVSGKTSGASEGTVVLVNGKRVTSTVANGGVFTFEDVKPPYDLYSVRHTDSPTATITDHVAYYRGLTRPDPTIEAPSLATLGVAPPTNKVTISGKLSGTAAPMSSNNPVVLVWTGSSDSIAVRVTGGKDYSFERTWLGLTVGKQAGTVYALQTDNALGTWRGYAEGAIALANGESGTLDLVMTTPATAKVTGTITPPNGFPSPSVAPTFHFGAHKYPFGTLPSSATIEFLMPIATSLAMSFDISSKLGGAVSDVTFAGIKAAADLSYALKSPPAFTAPAASSAANHSTSFTWTRPADTVSVVRWTVGKVRYEVFTAAADTTIPAITEKGFSPDNGKWTVDVYGPMTSVDDIAGPEGRRPESMPLRHHANADGERPFVWSPAP